jgi:guanylate kinase
LVRSNALLSSSSLADHRLIIVVSGPGGVGKGTIVDALVRRDDGLWLSRSWTTRERRPGEAADAYEFTDSESFEDRIRSNGFLEWTEFLGNYYGTPRPDLIDDDDAPDIVLEIEVDGASQVKEQYPDAVLIFVLPPSREEQERRLRGRGDATDKVLARLRKAEKEEPIGRAIADHLVVNGELDDTIDEMMAIVAAERTRRRT